MINLKLAEKLKAAGFPQEPGITLGSSDGQTCKGSFYFSSPPEACGGESFFTERELAERKAQFPNDIFIKLPTPSELIEEIHNILDVGSGYIEIAVKRLWTLDKNKWQAVVRFGKGCQEGDIGFWEIKEMGESDKEAVARLWLELKHKEDERTGPIGAVWCSEHKLYHQDFCPESADRDRIKAGHPLE